MSRRVELCGEQTDLPGKPGFVCVLGKGHPNGHYFIIPDCERRDRLAVEPTTDYYHDLHDVPADPMPMFRHKMCGHMPRIRGQEDFACILSQGHDCGHFYCRPDDRWLQGTAVDNAYRNAEKRDYNDQLPPAEFLSPEEASQHIAGKKRRQFWELGYAYGLKAKPLTDFEKRIRKEEFGKVSPLADLDMVRDSY